MTLEPAFAVVSNDEGGGPAHADLIVSRDDGKVVFRMGCNWLRLSPALARRTYRELGCIIREIEKDTTPA